MKNNKQLVNKLLTYTFVIFLFTIGIDKVVQKNFISDWQSLIGPVVYFLSPLHASTIVIVEGIIEIMLGTLLLTRWKTGSLALLVLMIAIITTDLFILHYYNLAIREIILIIVCVAIYLLDRDTTE
jgi:uncharacterized membrane protein